MSNKLIYCNDVKIDRKYRRSNAMRYLARRKARRIPDESYERIQYATNSFEIPANLKTCLANEDYQYLKIFRSMLIQSIEAEMLYLDARSEELPDMQVGWSSQAERGNLSMMEDQLQEVSSILMMEM